MKKYIQTSEGQKWLSDYILNMELGEFGFVIEINTGKATTPQRNAMHLYFRRLATTLNDSGLHMAKVLAEGTEIEWTENSVKKDIWGKVMVAMTGKTSTTQLERAEVNDIYLTVSRHLAQTFGVMLSFPNKFGD